MLINYSNFGSDSRRPHPPHPNAILRFHPIDRRDGMTEDQCSHADVCSTAVPPIPSGSSSGDEGCTRARRQSVDGGQKDGTYDFLDVSFSTRRFP